MAAPGLYELVPVFNNIPAASLVNLTYSPLYRLDRISGDYKLQIAQDCNQAVAIYIQYFDPLSGKVWSDSTWYTTAVPANTDEVVTPLNQPRQQVRFQYSFAVAPTTGSLYVGLLLPR